MSIIKRPILDTPSKEQIEELSPYKGLSNEGLEEKVEQLIKFFAQYGINYDMAKLEHTPIIDEKKAYPNYDQYQYVPGQHNLQKWIDAVRKIYASEKSGLTRRDAVRQSTNGWNLMETFDFLNWLRFYQEGTHLKYKTAQLWYENGQPGYFLQIKPDASKPAEPIVDHNAINEVAESAERQEEKKRIIEKQRQKIIGRLDSAEKLLRSPEGQTFAGPEMETLMEAIFSLKKKVQLVNKLSTSARLYEDMIVREGNALCRKGFIKAAEVLYSVAQANNPPIPGLGKPGPIEALPQPVPPDDPSGAGHPGAPGGLPSLGPGMPQPSGSPPTGQSETQPVNPKSPSKLPTSDIAQGPMSINQELPKGLADFLEGTETAGKTVLEDTHVVDDKLEIEDTLEVEDEHLLVTEAQMVSTPPVDEDVPMTTKPSKSKPIPPTPKNKPIEVTDDTPPANEAGVENAPAGAKDFDRIIDSALSNVTVADTVAKLEDIAKIFKTREIPRQLSLVDMMLDSLNLAAFFPTLSEAINKSLESNNYVSTRLEDIIARLRGALASKTVDLKGEQPSRAGDIANNLQQQADKEEARKKMRREQEAAELQGGAEKETPRVEVGEDLGAPPAAAPTAAPPRTRPLG